MRPWISGFGSLGHVAGTEDPCEFTDFARHYEDRIASPDQWIHNVPPDAPGTLWTLPASWMVPPVGIEKTYKARMEYGFRCQVSALVPLLVPRSSEPSTSHTMGQGRRQSLEGVDL